jgi:hypothetical protein
MISLSQAPAVHVHVHCVIKDIRLFMQTLYYKIYGTVVAFKSFFIYL